MSQHAWSTHSTLNELYTELAWWLEGDSDLSVDLSDFQMEVLLGVHDLINPALDVVLLGSDHIRFDLTERSDAFIAIAKAHGSPTYRAVIRFGDILLRASDDSLVVVIDALKTQAHALPDVRETFLVSPHVRVKDKRHC